MKVTIIGDQFMKSEFFRDALDKNITDGKRFDYRLFDLPWPDEPMNHGYHGDALDGLKEYQGSVEQVLELAAGADILITHLAPVSASMVAQLPDLKLVAVSRGGPVNIDVKALDAAGIAVVNAPGRNAGAVAEFTIGAIIAETRNIARGHAALMQGHWRGELYRADVQFDELSRLTIGLIGYGEIGSRVAKLACAFSSKVLVNDPYVEVPAEMLARGVEQVSFDALLERADVVSLHARVTPETTGFINASAFAKMRPGAVFINTARGPMVDYQALYSALASKHLGGAMLETFDREPLPDNYPLLSLDNVTLTPHIAGASLSTVRIAAELVAEDVWRFCQGQPLLRPTGNNILPKHSPINA